MGKTKRADIEYPFEHGEVIKLHFGWCIITPSHYKNTSVFPNSVALTEENHSGFHHESKAT
jgi:hypothetical protein